MRFFVPRVSFIRLLRAAYSGAVPLFLALLLSACDATNKPEPEIKRAEPKPQEIQIQTAPPGALVDWNGNVLGVTPVTIELTPSGNVNMTPIIGKSCTALSDSQWKIEEIPNSRSQIGTTKCRAGLRISWICANLPLRTGLFYLGV